VFKQALVKANIIDAALSEYLDEEPLRIEAADNPIPLESVPILKCPKCNTNMVLKTKRQGNGKYIGCMAYPTCNNVIWLPESVEDVEILDEGCSIVSFVSLPPHSVSNL
jgi:DNA topoisomerase-3